MKLKRHTNTPNTPLSFEAKCLIFLFATLVVITVALVADYRDLLPSESDLIPVEYQEETNGRVVQQGSPTPGDEGTQRAHAIEEADGPPKSMVAHTMTENANEEAARDMDVHKCLACKLEKLEACSAGCRKGPITCTEWCERALETMEPLCHDECYLERVIHATPLTSSKS